MTDGCDDGALRELIDRQLRGEDTCSGGSWKIEDDVRITKFGSLLRRTSLDELPQLFNVLLGTMSLVGPRPMLEWQAEAFPSEYDHRFAVSPGITGLWQVSGRSTVSTLEMLQLDVRYVHQRTLVSDFGILVRTIPAVLRGDGAR
jgi:lipopolysaccharide/colanic/teichoic acid biosynthesis glycosyltransferase